MLHDTCCKSFPSPKGPTDLFNNSFDGNLLFEVGQLLNLNCFIVSLNRISGEIPTSLANCKRLVFLNLSSNLLVGTIPMSLEALVATEEGDLSSNNLTRLLPAYFIKFTAIQFLDLSFNNLSGEVPVEVLLEMQAGFQSGEIMDFVEASLSCICLHS